MDDDIGFFNQDIHIFRIAEDGWHEKVTSDDFYLRAKDRGVKSQVVGTSPLYEVQRKTNLGERVGIIFADAVEQGVFQDSFEPL